MNVVAIYARVSTADQDLSGQERDLAEYVVRRGWAVGAVYREKVSARGTVEREQFDLLLADARSAARPWTRVLVWSLDRWSRDPSFVKAIGAVEQLEARGIRFHSLKEPVIDSSEDGSPSVARDVLRALLPIVAAFESRRRSDRVRVAMREIRDGRRKTRSGRPPGRPVRATPERVAEAAALRAKGMGWPEIARRTALKTATAQRAVRRLKAAKGGQAQPLNRQNGMPVGEGG